MNFLRKFLRLFSNYNSNQTELSMSYQIFTYRTKDGVAYFKFSYHWVENGYEIDLHEQPHYEGRSEDCHTSHRLNSPRDTVYMICIVESAKPKTLEAAQNLSKAYAEYTWEYIKSGITIDAQINIETKNREL